MSTWVEKNEGKCVNDISPGHDIIRRARAFHKNSVRIMHVRTPKCTQTNNKAKFAHIIIVFDHELCARLYVAVADLAACSIWLLGRKSAALQSEFHLTLSSAHKVSHPSSERKDVQIFRTCEKTRSLLALPAGTTSNTFIKAARCGKRTSPACESLPIAPQKVSRRLSAVFVKGGRSADTWYSTNSSLRASRLSLGYTSAGKMSAMRITETIHSCPRTRVCEITEYKS